MNQKRNAASNPADLVLTNGTIITVDPNLPTAEAIAVKGNRIAWVGLNADAKEWIAENTRTIDLEGAFVYPGFIDSHAHIVYTGMSKKALQLWNVKSKQAVLEMVKAETENVPPGTWIWGLGWDERCWQDDKTFPTLEELTTCAPQHPIVLQRSDTHLIAINKMTLDTAKIDAKTPDSEGGKIYRDSNGNPTGILSDRAMFKVWKVMPKPTLEENMKLTQFVLQECLQKGITSIHNAATYEDDFEAFKTLALKNELPVRIYVMGTVNDKIEGHFFENGPQNYGPFLDARCLKLFIDGALGSRGAALLEPYADEPHHSGELAWKKKELWKILHLAKEMGFQVGAHAIGDKANRFLLDAYEGTGCHGLRWRIEHAQLLHPDDVPRFGKLGIIAAVQPLHATEDMVWMDGRLGKNRVEAEAFPWRDLIDNGATLAGGSDAPVVEINPLWGIYAAITRQDHEGNPVGGWHSRQKMMPFEALQAYTINAAYSAFRENELGTLTPGKLADIVVLPENILTCEPAKLLNMPVLYTIVHGTVRYVM